MFAFVVMCACTLSSPTLIRGEDKIDYYLDTFLELYYDTYLPRLDDDRVETSPLDEGMQSDQPAESNAIGGPYRVDTNDTSFEDYIRENRARSKEVWMSKIKMDILKHVGRSNSSFYPSLNHTIDVGHVMDSLQKGANASVDQFVTEKLRSFYPSCETPKNYEHDIKKDENTMNLYVDVDQLKGNVSSATLRLYRSNVHGALDHEEVEEKLYRITVYFYTKTRKHRAKKKMCDCKMMSDQSPWTELNVRPAIRAWTEGKNLGLAVQVEDQEGRVIRADSFFKGCIVGASTPKPIPTIIFDASLLHEPPAIPTIDICTLELPENYTAPINSTGQHVCSLLRAQSIPAPPIQLVPLQQPASTSTTRHIRHQRQHQREAVTDPRSHIIQRKVIITNEELQSLNSTENR